MAKQPLPTILIVTNPGHTLVRLYDGNGNLTHRVECKGKPRRLPEGGRWSTPLTLFRLNALKPLLSPSAYIDLVIAKNALIDRYETDEA